MSIEKVLDNNYFNTLNKAIETFGEESQITKTVEEIGETLATLGQNLFNRSSRMSVSEELGDSFIMFTQILILFDYNIGEIKSIILEAQQKSKDKLHDFPEDFRNCVTNFGLFLSVLFNEHKPQEVFIDFMTSIIDMIGYYGEEETIESMNYKIKRLNNRIEEFKKFNS